MKYNILIGGSAGQGIETSASILEWIFKASGLEVFTTRDYMSRIRGGHNFIQIRFGDEKLTSHAMELDGIIAVNNETAELHTDRLKEDGFILGDTDLTPNSQNVILEMAKTAKEIGNARVSGSVAVGAVLKIFGLELEKAQKVLQDFFNEKVLDVNVEAVSRGYEMATKKYDLSTKEDKNRYLINGNEGIALGALAAGVKFYSAYPMTPSTSIMNYISAKMEEAKVVVEQAEDEIAGINMAIGASYAGVRAMTGTSGGGFCLKVEALGLAGMIEAPLVVANIQRPGPATGFPTRTEQADLKFIINSSHGEFPKMVIAVRDPEDAFYQTVRAFNLADKYQMPIIILGDQYHADSTTTMDAFDFDKVTIERHLADPDKYKDKEYKRYELTASGISDRLIPGRTHGNVVLVDSDEHDESGFITESAEVRINMVNKRMNKMKLLSEELLEPRLFGKEDCEVLLVGWGSTQGALQEAVQTLNEKGGSYGALVYGDIYPMPIKTFQKMAKTAKTIINVEQNATGQLRSLLVENTGIFTHKSILKYDGRQISAGEIVQKLEGGEA
jgi:2-oxoglutarate/2-oxoacid ferredoxin oxidoreductase subunit alpha